MFSGLVLVGLAACKFEAEWAKFKLEHGKEYAAHEEKSRFANFVDNMNYAELFNRIDKSAKYGATIFSDLSAAEFAQRYLSDEMPEFPEGAEFTAEPEMDLPASFDWTSHANIVSAVQDQKSCGGCWAFSVTAGTESALAVAGKGLVKLSEQTLIDCDKTNSGCNGGNRPRAEAWVQQNGLVLESVYPFANKDQTCNVPSSAKRYKITGYGNINGESNMAAALVKYGILPVGIYATPLQVYKSGIINNSSCPTNRTNHAVNVVGYGTENGTQFWKVRNSWGPSWGEKGYFRIVRGKNMCSIGLSPTYVQG